MRVALGSDHRGVEQRVPLRALLEQRGHEVVDLGTNSSESVDYPDIAALVARRVANGEADRGLLICGTGIGMSIAANKVHGIRAAVCRLPEAAEMSRRHNDANVLCLSGAVAPADNATILAKWLETPFEGGRHQRRVDKISDLESC